MTQGVAATNKWNIVYVSDTRVLYPILAKLWEYFRISRLYEAFEGAD